MGFLKDKILKNLIIRNGIPAKKSLPQKGPDTPGRYPLRKAEQIHGGAGMGREAAKAGTFF